jgi:hydrogenase maturation protease
VNDVIKIPADVLVAGIGSMCRCDDAIGLIIVRKLAPRISASVEILEIAGEGSALMELWRGRRTVIVIGAISSDARTGTIYRFNATEDEIPAGLFVPPDAFGLGEAIELGRALDELPPRLLVYGVRGKNFGHGIGLSERVIAAADRVVEYILEDLEICTETETRRDLSHS